MSVLQGSSRLASMAAGSTRYLPVMNCLSGDSATESVAQIRAKTAGTFSMMWIRVRSNATTTASTVRFRKAAANGNQVITIASGTTGVFEDTTNSDTVASGDAINASAVIGATGSLGATVLTQLFQASSGETITHALQAATSSTVSAASTTTYARISGSTDITVATEANTKFRYHASGTWKLARASVTTNGRSTTTTIRSRINGANGNIVISVASSTTGIIEDTTNSDSYAVGDDLNYSITTGTGAGSFSVTSLASDFQLGGTAYMSFNGSVGNTIATSVTNYYTIFGGRLDATTTESDIQTEARGSYTLSKLSTYLVTNGVSASSTLRMRVNGANGNQSVTLTASTTGYYEDASNSDSVVDGDLIAVQLATGASGTNLSPSYIGALITPVTTTTNSGFFLFA